MNAGYEAAPSTALLATHCVCCGRALRDAASVERGVGPDCAEKYGFGLAQGAADWERVGVLARGFGHDDFAALTDAWGDAHKAANVLTHRAACAQRSARGLYVDIIAALGFAKLALALATAAGEVVEVALVRGAAGGRDDRYAVKTPFCEAFSTALKAARIGARWDREGKVWTVPCDKRARLFSVLRATFSGALLVSAKGATRLSALRGRARGPERPRGPRRANVARKETTP